jgi:PTS system nitrogen regulatory IIA component
MVVTIFPPWDETRKSAPAPDLIALPQHIASGSYRKGSAARGITPEAGAGGMLREQDVVLGMAAKGKRSALAKIAGRLAERVDMRPSTVLAGLLRRERLGSTGVGHGVAVPHARLGGLVQPAAMLVVLDSPVWFGSADDEQVDLLLTLVWPKDDVAGFLPTLASFCRRLRQADLRARLRAAATPHEAHAWLELRDSPPAAPPVARRRQRQPSPGATCLRIASMTCAL